MCFSLPYLSPLLTENELACRSTGILRACLEDFATQTIETNSGPTSAFETLLRTLVRSLCQYTCKTLCCLD